MNFGEISCRLVLPILSPSAPQIKATTALGLMSHPGGLEPLSQAERNSISAANSCSGKKILNGSFGHGY